MHTFTLVIMALVLASDILTVTFFGVIIGALHFFKLKTVSIIASRLSLVTIVDVIAVIKFGVFKRALQLFES